MVFFVFQLWDREPGGGGEGDGAPAVPHSGSVTAKVEQI